MSKNIIQGKIGAAISYASIMEDEAREQIRRMCDYEITRDSVIRIMPDVHAGAGCTIGTTMTVTDKIVPNIVGVDIGCGMLTTKIADQTIGLIDLDQACHSIPSGYDVWDGRQEHFDLQRLRCYRQLRNTRRLERSLGTLGGGNHFIEMDKSDDAYYLVIHSGSRNLGKQVAEYYQHLAIELHQGKEKYLKAREELIKEYKAQGRRSEIQGALEELTWQKHQSDIPDDLAYLYGEYMDDYLHDIVICQEFADASRKLMAKIICERCGYNVVEQFSTIHNYISTDEMIIRKGAISAHKDEKVLIPMNMGDGCIIGIGKGNADWNYSAPHGAGRLMSRKKAKDDLSMDEYRKVMSDHAVYSTTISEATLDEAPMAYKPMSEILKDVQETIEVQEIIKPVYNFKAS